MIARWSFSNAHYDRAATAKRWVLGGAQETGRVIHVAQRGRPKGFHKTVSVSISRRPERVKGSVRPVPSVHKAGGNVAARKSDVRGG